MTQYVQVADFLDTLDAWTGRPPFDFPTANPPCGHFVTPDTDEGVELATIFFRLASTEDLSAQQFALVTAIMVHENRWKLEWDHAKGNRDPKWVAPRADWFRLRQYEDMINVLKEWLDALHQRACVPA